MMYSLTLFYPANCPDPAPGNGSAIFPHGTSVGDSAVISCDTGYILQGDSYIACRDDGSWSDTPTCLLIGNPPFYLSP